MIPVGILTAAATSSFSYLLDDYPGAIAAYSFRKLRSAYTGACCAIISNGVQTDINFVNNYVDTNAIINNGLIDASIVVWYDQSGNGNNMTRNFASAGKLKIANVLQTINSKLVANFNNSIGMVNANSINLKNGFSNFTACQIDTTTVNNYFFSKGANDLALAAIQALNYWGLAKDAVLNIAIENTKAPVTYTLFTSYYDGTNAAIKTNGTIKATGTYSNSGLTNNGGLYLASEPNFTAGYLRMSESVFYQSTQLANQTGIQANINSYYTIY